MRQETVQLAVAGKLTHSFHRRHCYGYDGFSAREHEAFDHCMEALYHQGIVVSSRFVHCGGYKVAQRYATSFSDMVYHASMLHYNEIIQPKQLRSQSVC